MSSRNSIIISHVLDFSNDVLRRSLILIVLKLGDKSVLLTKHKKNDGSKGTSKLCHHG